MNKLTTTLIATALVTTIGATALTNVANAQDRPQPSPDRHAPMIGIMEEFGGAGRVCAPDRAEKLDAMLSRLAKRIDLTARQTEVFEVFRADALVAQTEVADTCAEVKPGEDADLIDRLNAGQAVLAVRLEEMAKILPSLEIFYDSLTDEQKARLRPSRMAQRQLPHQGAHTHAPKDPDSRPPNNATVANGAEG